MIQDLHSHTYYSFCGRDNPETVLQAAIDGGIQLFGFTDHHYGIGNGRYDIYKANPDFFPDDYGRTLIRYYDHMNLIREKYKDKITVLCGIEVCTLLDPPRAALPDSADISHFDYCLIENLDTPEGSIAKGDLFSFAERCACPAGIAHTDLFSFIQTLGEKPLDYFKRMADCNIFWEMNVSYDSIHKYREHAYVLEFFRNEEQQAIVRESGVKLSIGFDGHRVEDYLPQRVADFCKKVEEIGIPLAFSEKYQNL